MSTSPRTIEGQRVASLPFLGVSRRERGTQARLPWRRPAPSPAMDESHAAAWLAAGHGEPAKLLNAKTQGILLDGFKAGDWTKDDVMQDETSKDDAKTLWGAILKDCAKNQKTDIGQADIIRLNQWIDAMQLGGTEDEPVDVSSTSKKYIPSAAEQKDLDAQGMKEPLELRKLELSIFLGRAVSIPMIKNGVYKEVPNPMDGARLAFKQNMATIVDVLKECRKAESVNPLDNFIQALADDLAASDSESDRMQSARVHAWWNRTQRNLMHVPGAILQYVEDYRVRYRGRGLVEDYDQVLGQRAWHEASAAGMHGAAASTKSLASLPKGALGSTGGSTVAGSTISSALGSSASGSSGNETAMIEQMKELMTTVRGLSSNLNSLTSKVHNLSSDKNDATITCSKCHEKGHRSANCPHKKKGDDKEG